MKKIIGVLHTEASDMIEWLNQGHHMIRSVMPDEKREVGILILPDCGGVNLNSGNISLGNTFPPDLPSYSQGHEFFRLNTLDWYLSKGWPVFGFGSGGIMLGTTLGLKFVLTGRNVQPMIDTQKEFSKEMSALSESVWWVKHGPHYMKERCAYSSDEYRMILDSLTFKKPPPTPVAVG